MIELRAATKEDVLRLGGEPIVASTLDMIAFEKAGTVVAVAGVTPITLMSDVGIVWIICPDVKEIVRDFLRFSKPFMEAAALRYRVLLAAPDFKKDSLRGWFERLGFDTENPVLEIKEQGCLPVWTTYCRS